ncbi:MAG TPA: TlpA disulfide reductase family protein [Alphaproteobacteria bacterium]|nr:TlpA disulfide reductase family protein [Alphaproteobacteria bacterium]
MKANLIILFLVLALTGMITVVTQSWHPSSNNHVQREDAKDFSYVTLDGQKAALKDLSGKVVLLHFWATWCPPCVVEFPDLIKLAEKQGDDFVILAVSSDKNKKDIDKFLKKINRPLPDNFIIALDSDSHITQALYGADKLPESHLISKDSELVETIIGPQENWSDQSWQEKIIRLRGE